MAQERTITISALNVAMHNPHSPQRYVDLLKEARRRQILVPQGEIHGLMLGVLYGSKDAVENNELTGEVYRFLKVDQNEAWFNLRERRRATEEEVQDINIPRHLLAHMQKIPFVFLPKQHELWFIAADRKARLAPPAAGRFFQTILTDAANRLDYPSVDVTVLPDAGALDDMFSVAHLHKIVMKFNRPNADDGAELEARFMARMEAQNLKSISTEMLSDEHRDIQPDEATVRDARIAARNGAVAIEGRDLNGAKVQLSTAQRPARFFKIVDSAIESAMDVLRRTPRDR